MRCAPWQCDPACLVFIAEFNPRGVFAVDLNHFDDPLKQLTWIGKQRRVADRTGEPHLRPFHDEIQSAACLGFVTAGCAEVALLVGEEIVSALGNQPERRPVLDCRCRPLA